MKPSLRGRWPPGVSAVLRSLRILRIERIGSASMFTELEDAVSFFTGALGTCSMFFDILLICLIMLSDVSCAGVW